MENDGGDIREQAAEQAFLLGSGEVWCHISFFFHNLIPCVGNNVCGVPQGAVHIKNNTVDQEFFLHILRVLVILLKYLLILIKNT